MLLPFSPCGIPPDLPETGCAWLAETGEVILAEALSGLLPFIPDDSGPCADTFDTYLIMGPPVAETYDALSVNLVSYGMSPQAKALWQKAGSCGQGYPATAAEWNVVLWENCWPQPEVNGETVTVPSPEMLDAVSQWTYAHGMAIWNAVTLAVVSGSWELPRQITNVTVGDLTPLGPQGGAVGWKFAVTTTIG